MKRNKLIILLVLALAAVFALNACSPSTAEIAETTAVPSDLAAEPTDAPAATPLPNPTQVPEPTTIPATEVPVADEVAVETIMLTDGLGNEIVLVGPARKVISLAPSNTEILFAVGAGAQVVGRDAFSDFPPEALDVPDIGGGFGELDMETIVALEPDLVFVADITPPEQVQTLTDIGLTVYALANPTDIASMYENLRIAAQLTGHEEETELLISTLEARVTAVTETVANATVTPLVFYEIDSTEPDAPWTSGPGTFTDTLIQMAGGNNVGSVLEGDWAQISIEELITQDPDIILLGDYTWGGVTPEDVAARSSWQGLTAVQNENVFTFDDNLVTRPGPRLVDGLEAFAQQLHPELFE